MADEKKDDRLINILTPMPPARKKRRSHVTQVLKPIAVINPGDLLDGQAPPELSEDADIDLLFSDPPPKAPAPSTPPPTGRQPSLQAQATAPIPLVSATPAPGSRTEEPLTGEMLDPAPPEDLSAPTPPPPSSTGALHFVSAAVVESQAPTKKDKIPKELKSTTHFNISQLPVSAAELLGDFEPELTPDDIAPQSLGTAPQPQVVTGNVEKIKTTLPMPPALTKGEALIEELLESATQEAHKQTTKNPVISVQQNQRHIHTENIETNNKLDPSQPLELTTPLDTPNTDDALAIASAATERDSAVQAALAAAAAPTDVIQRKKSVEPIVHVLGQSEAPPMPPQDAVPTQQSLQAVPTPARAEPVDYFRQETSEPTRKDGTTSPPDDASATQESTDFPIAKSVPTSPEMATAPTPQTAKARVPFVQFSQGSPNVRAAREPRYEELKPLGSDALAEHYLLKDNDLQRLVVCKRLRQTLHTPEGIAHWVQHVQHMGQLNHPSIPPLYDVGVDDKGRYYTTEKYIGGDSLTLIIERLRNGDPSYHKRFGQTTRFEIATALIHALRFAHAQGIIHSDITPACITIGPYGDVALHGWELASQIRNRPSHPKAEPLPPTLEMPHTNDATSPYQRMIQQRIGDLQLSGTLAYMAPERLQGMPADERSDIFSLCATIYEFLTLQHHLGLTSNQIPHCLQAIPHNTPAPAKELAGLTNTPLPTSLTTVLQQALSKEPQKRPTRLEPIYASFQSQVDKEAGLSPLVLSAIVICAALSTYGLVQLGMQLWRLWAKQP